MVKKSGDQQSDIAGRIVAGADARALRFKKLLPSKRSRLLLLSFVGFIMLVWVTVAGVRYHNARGERYASRAATLSAKGDYKGARRAVDSAIEATGATEQKTALYMQKATICTQLKDTSCVVSSYQAALKVTKDNGFYAATALALADYSSAHNRKSDALTSVEQLRQKVASLPKQQIAIKGQDIIDLARLDEILSQLKERR